MDESDLLLDQKGFLNPSIWLVSGKTRRVYQISPTIMGVIDFALPGQILVLMYR
jgi:hypothetical protein